MTLKKLRTTDGVIKIVALTKLFSEPHNIRLEGQFDQVRIVSELFKDKRDGFFIEAGYVVIQ